LAGLFSRVSVEEWGNKDRAVAIGRDEKIVATTWWSAHIASQLLRGQKFTYFIQEYEPLTVPQGSWSAMAEQSYELPHDALFSTPLLQTFFKRRGLGAFHPSGSNSSRQASFTPPAVPLSASNARPERLRQVVCYLRSEPHAARNLYEILIEALTQVLGRLPSEGLAANWTFIGIGGAEDMDVVVGPSSIRLLGKLSLDDYGDVLMASRVGVALMHAPHPSMVPIDMASAGLNVVTTTFETKTSRAMKKIAPNIEAVPPEPSLIAEAVIRAMRVSEDRTVAPRIDMPRSWEFDLDWIMGRPSAGR
jgi:hypothetical protein